MSPLSLPRNVVKYVSDAADATGLPPGDVLARVLNVREPEEDERFSVYLTGAPPVTRRVFAALDYALLCRNPGSHYVFRKLFVGYRRQTNPADGPHSRRNDIFASLVPRKHHVRVVLPLQPSRYADTPGVEDLTGIGHHGVGDLAFDVAQMDDVDAFVESFADWLRYPIPKTPRA